jgi:Heterokaryon incompatibility protein (HET)
MVVVSNVNQDIVSPTLCVYTNRSRANQILALAKVASADRPPWSYLAPFHSISAEFRSEGSFELVQQWIRECEATHKSCRYRLRQALPKRVIELVTNSHTPKLRLINSAGLIGLYCALSHCWGSLEYLRLTKASSDPLQQSIQWQHLPKTFQDAVIVTRNVGIRYLWIDSLCIYQDDAADWASEAANMAAVYSNAFLVIAASSASDGSIGCFRKRKQLPCVEIRSKVHFITRRVIRPKIIAQEGFEHVDFDPNPVQTNTKREPLLDRAWAFQERWLATRILHYASNEMIWECKSSMHCECGGYEKEQDNRVTSLDFDGVYYGADPLKIVAEWFVIVKNYTARRLQRESDKLVALAGIARHLRRPDLGRYFAGIWEVAFVRSLLWFAMRHQHTLTSARNLRAYVAPSWSWASVRSPVQYIRDTNLHDPVDADVVEAACELRSPDEHGQVIGGFATMRARLTNLKLVNNGLECDDEDGYGGRVVPPLVKAEDNQILTNLWLDVALYEGSDFCSNGQALIGALIMIDPLHAHKCFALILRPLKPQEARAKNRDSSSIFVRIGMTTGARVSLFEKEKETLTVI